MGFSDSPHRQRATWLSQPHRDACRDSYRTLWSRRWRTVLAAATRRALRHIALRRPCSSTFSARRSCLCSMSRNFSIAEWSRSSSFNSDRCKTSVSSFVFEHSAGGAHVVVNVCRSRRPRKPVFSRYLRKFAMNVAHCTFIIGFILEKKLQRPLRPFT